jgi:hypothetical protein
MIDGLQSVEWNTMRTIRSGAVVLAVVALSGCAVAPGPSVMVMPGQGKSFEAFQADDAACRQFATQQTGIAPADAANQSLVSSAAVGTVLGAATGAAIGAAVGNPAAGAAIGAGSGLALGAASGVGAAQYSGGAVQQRYDVGYVQCMSAKGENVPQMPATQTAYAQPPGYAYPAPAYAYPYPYPYYYPGYYRPAYVGFGFRGGWGWHRH